MYTIVITDSYYPVKYNDYAIMHLSRALQRMLLNEDGDGFIRKYSKDNLYFKINL